MTDDSGGHWSHDGGAATTIATTTSTGPRWPAPSVVGRARGGRYRDIVDWLGVRPGHVVVDVGSGAGGMAAALADAVGHDGHGGHRRRRAQELLAVARQHARRPGQHLVTLHARLGTAAARTACSSSSPSTSSTPVPSSTISTTRSPRSPIWPRSCDRADASPSSKEGSATASCPTTAASASRDWSSDSRSTRTPGSGARSVRQPRPCARVGAGTCCSPRPGSSTSRRARSCSISRRR